MNLFWETGKVYFLPALGILEEASDGISSQEPWDILVATAFRELPEKGDGSMIEISLTCCVQPG